MDRGSQRGQRLIVGKNSLRMIFSENRFPSTDQVSEDKLFGIMR